MVLGFYEVYYCGVQTYLSFSHNAYCERVLYSVINFDCFACSPRYVLDCGANVFHREHTV